MGKERALEVGCGDGMLTRDYILPLKFKAIDMFDKCPIGIGKVNEFKPEFSTIDSVSIEKMEDFVWQRDYSAIYMRWCVGYLDDNNLKLFLMNAKRHLITEPKARTRSSHPKSYIFILDNVLEEFELKGVEPVKGERQRASSTLDKIFKDAGLKIMKKS